MNKKLIILSVCLLLAGCISFSNVHIDGNIKIGNQGGEKRREHSVFGIKPKAELLAPVAPTNIPAPPKQKIVYKVPKGYCPEFDPPELTPLPALPMDEIILKSSEDEKRTLMFTYVEKLRGIDYDNRAKFAKSYEEYLRACKNAK